MADRVGTGPLGTNGFIPRYSPKVEKGLDSTKGAIDGLAKEESSMVEDVKGYAETGGTLVNAVVEGKETLGTIKDKGGRVLKAVNAESLIEKAAAGLQVFELTDAYKYLKGTGGALGAGASLIGVGLNVAAVATGDFSEFDPKEFSNNISDMGEGLKTLGDVATRFTPELTKAVAMIEKVVPPAQIIGGTVGLAVEGKAVYDNIANGDYQTDEGKWDLASHGAGALASGCMVAAGACAVTGVGAPVAAVLSGVAAAAGVVQLAIDNRETITDIAQTVEEGVSTAAAAVVETASEVVDTVSDRVSETANAVAETASEIVDTVSETVSEATNAVVETASEVVNTVSDAVSEAATSVAETATEVVNTVSDAVSEAMDSAGQFLGKLKFW